ncbi:heavy metal translocating P-type ATPase [Amycolatopsis jiangsuensis]|uniref:Cu+-exporting ATPase n=1 Tax=Amycolatopsis jiangsuensis TaxID=1181879 RepID=A0A840ISL0_9PSEU|nr:heavy metal translocating P-type ATPase [Amycolatopsis jiangsuensis]MBB4684128.1 Cu+-exporting ATPase [Amycolatopsis jiangsuensis]
MTTATPAPPAVRTVELNVTGMTCAACSARVERALNKIDGVRASVNYATERATVHASAAVGDDVLLERVRKAGYRARPREAGSPDLTEARVRDLRRRLIVAAVLAVPVGDLSITLALVPSLRFPGWQVLCLALAVPVVFWAALPFHRAALRNLRHRSSSMDTLVSLGVLASFTWSAWTTLSSGTESGYWVGFGPTAPGADAVYLDVAAGVTTFLLAGRYFESRSRRSAAGLLEALDALAAKEVRVLRDGTEALVPIAELAVGDRFVVRPGEALAADGIVESGRSTVDTSALTGEPVPAEVSPADRVIGASVNREGRLVVRAVAVGAHTQLAQMTALAERAQARKASVQRLVDRICAVFVPAVLALAALTFAGWWWTGHPVRDAFTAAISVLIIACPCALGLATPTALAAGVGRGAQLGILIKGPEALEASRRVDTVVLDKTGTVTTGRMTFTAGYPDAGRTVNDLLWFAGAVEAGSEHAVAAAVVTAANAEVAELPAVTEFEALPGLGAQGTVDGRRVLLGSPRLFADRGIGLPEESAARVASAQEQGAVPVVVAVDGDVAGVLVVRDVVKPSARAAVAALRELGLRTVLLTGDHRIAAEAVGAEIGVDEVRAEVLPAAKAEVVERLRADGARVAMVGDGINDGPALAGADLGMAMAHGSDIALRSADVVLVREDLAVVPDAIRLADRTLGVLRGNLAWAFGYNVAALPLAALGLLNPLIAGAAMSLSSVLVVSNSLRLRTFR